MTARISLNLGRTGGYRPLLSKLRDAVRSRSRTGAGFMGFSIWKPVLGMSLSLWERDLLPEGEGHEPPFRLIWTPVVIDRPYVRAFSSVGQSRITARRGGQRSKNDCEASADRTLDSNFRTPE